MSGLIVAGVLVVLALVFLSKAIKIVREYQRVVVFRLGHSSAPKGPGLVIVIPIIDQVVWLDLRELYLEIPHQSGITKDNATISIDFIIFYKVLDAEMSVVKVKNFAGAAQNIAATTLRSVVGDMSLDDVLSKRQEMNEILRTTLDEVTERWGVKVTNVELREIIPPPAVLEAMTRQMSAERTRRAVVIEAEGTKSAAITVAEGHKGSAILTAEGAKQANILNAEGERQAALLRAEGFSSALGRIFEVAHGVEANTMSLRYLDALTQIGRSASTKLVIPVELSTLLATVVGATARSFGSGQHGPDAAKG
jgi:regulator of protease activity HflC (stomatin/prohibitin superfamily)